MRRSIRPPLTRYKTKISLLWIIAMAGTLTVVVFIRLSAESYSTGASRISVEREGDKRYKFLKRELIDIFDDLEEIEGSLHKLDEFTQNLDTIKGRILHQNKHFIERVREDERIIERVNSDEELREKIKDKL
jgi:acetate kinase